MWSSLPFDNLTFIFKNENIDFHTHTHTHIYIYILVVGFYGYIKQNFNKKISIRLKLIKNSLLHSDFDLLFKLLLKPCLETIILE